MALINHRIPCNEALANHPTCQAGLCQGSESDCEVGMLGIINGMLGTRADGHGLIVAISESEGKPPVTFQKNELSTGHCVTEPMP